MQLLLKLPNCALGGPKALARRLDPDEPKPAFGDSQLLHSFKLLAICPGHSPEGLSEPHGRAHSFDIAISIYATPRVTGYVNYFLP